MQPTTPSNFIIKVVEGADRYPGRYGKRRVLVSYGFLLQWPEIDPMKELRAEWQNVGEAHPKLQRLIG